MGVLGQQDQDQQQPIEEQMATATTMATTPKKPSFFQSLHVLKDPQFLSLTLANVTVSIGYLVPLYYMQSTWCFYFFFFPPSVRCVVSLLWATAQKLPTWKTSSHMIKETEAKIGVEKGEKGEKGYRVHGADPVHVLCYFSIVGKPGV